MAVVGTEAEISGSEAITAESDADAVPLLPAVADSSSIEVCIISTSNTHFAAFYKPQAVGTLRHFLHNLAILCPQKFKQCKMLKEPREQMGGNS